MDDESLFCSNCETQIKNDEYCPHCGLILLEEKKCYLHKEAEAEGICLICSTLCCNKCGKLVNNIFLCNEHNEYEIIEGMARVYGSNNSIGLDDNYEYALVGTPTRKYGWILSRTLKLSEDKLKEAFELLKSQGYEPKKFEMTLQ